MHARDVGDRDLLWAHRFALALVGAAPESFAVHLIDYANDAARALGLSLLFVFAPATSYLFDASVAAAQKQTVHVREYTRKDGMVVKAHERAAPRTKGSGTPKALHENVINVWGKTGQWKALASVTDDKDAYLFLLGRDGRILWRHNGGFREAAFAEMLSVARAAASTQ